MKRVLFFDGPMHGKTFTVNDDDVRYGYVEVPEMEPAIWPVDSAPSLRRWRYTLHHAAVPVLGTTRHGWLGVPWPPDGDPMPAVLERVSYAMVADWLNLASAEPPGRS